VAYVDLNPISAKMAKTPETSEHTSIQKRTEAIQQHKRQPYKLLPFVGNPRQDMPQGIAFPYKITVNWLTRQAVLSEQIKQVLSTQHKTLFWAD
jgi:hypothetical protein